MRVIARSSGFRIAWDLCAVALLMVAALVVSYELAFVHRVTLIGSLVVYAIDLFFLADIWLDFKTTYPGPGEDVTDPRQIARRYLGSMFPVDLLASLPFDVLLLASRDVTLWGVSVVLLLRSLRLLRVARLFAIFRRWERLSWTNAGSLRIAKFLLLIVLALHCVASVWFLVPYAGGFPADSWVIAEKITDASPETQYIRSLYWAIVTTTTVGYGDITPNRNVEYVLSMVTILLGASMYAFIIGNIASLLSTLDSSKAAFWNRVESVNQYLRSRRVTPELNDQVRRYYEYIWARFRGMNERHLLADLPTPIRLEIFLELTSELIERVPLFLHCSDALRNVLLIALRPQIYVPDSYIAREGEVGGEIFFLSGGTAEIVADDGRRSHGLLRAGDHFGDLSLLLGERRTAGVRALTFCDVFVLEREDFERIKRDYEELRTVLKTVSSEKSETMSELVLAGVIL